MGSVRIHSGKHAKRNITFSDDLQIRPTGVRVRQVLFDWIRFEMKDKRCLDLFAGSGILGFEALSQGGGSVLCIDQDQQVCHQIASEASRISEENIAVACLTIPCTLSQQFDICFVDPPFSDPVLVFDTMRWIHENNLVVSDGLVYVETPVKCDQFAGFSQIKQKKVGNVWMHLYKRVSDE